MRKPSPLIESIPLHFVNNTVSPNRLVVSVVRLISIIISALIAISIPSIVYASETGTGKVCHSETQVLNRSHCIDAVNLNDSSTQQDSKADTKTEIKKDSPWLATPILSSDPKMGTSLGAMGAYMHKFDESSPASMFGLFGNYSDTDSYMLGGFARMNFDQDRQRLVIGSFTGDIKNSYSDFLGTGLAVKTRDNISVTVGQYLHRLGKSDWFFGLQGVSVDYQVSAENDSAQNILDALELSGFASKGLGAVAKYDSRDNINSPYSGQEFTLNNTAFRESLGGDVSFDAYAGKYRSYHHYGAENKNHVLAWRADGRWTSSAPRSGYSSVDLRGYIRGNYLAPHMSVVEIEERFALTKQWSLAAFTGAACLYESSSDCGYSDNWYPTIGGGVRYLLKPQERMVIRADYAWGKGENRGFYFAFGQAF